MKGEYRIIVEDKFLKYDFVIRRNITVVKGNSGTGKTTLIDMLAESKTNSSILVQSSVPCKVIRGDNEYWRFSTMEACNSILFLMKIAIL